MILLELFLSFLQIGLFSVGGGYAAIPLIHNQTVELHSWLTETQFMDLATIAEMTPGPIAINGATFVGLNIAGIPGAVMATLGCICPSIVIVSLLSWVYAHYSRLPLLQGILACLRPAVVALIAAAGLRMMLQVAFTGGQGISLRTLQWFRALLFVLAFFLLRRFKKNPIVVMALCGGISLLAGILTDLVPVG